MIPRRKLAPCKSVIVQKCYSVEKRLRAYQIPTRILQFKLCYVTFVLIKTEIQFKILKYKENMFLKQNERIFALNF